jgi:hypothetical protein
VISLQAFHVAGQSQLNNTPALIVDTKERTFSKGEGSQGQHHIVIEGRGSTTGRLYIDQISGILLQKNFTATDTLTVHSSGRTQRFLQVSTGITQKIR